MADNVKIGFIGCGGNARGHMNTLNKMEDVKIVATCDIQEGLAASAAEMCEAEAFTDHKVMLDKKELDAVYISIPVFAHGAPELDTIQRGLPFFVEKPVAISMEKALEIQEAVEKSNTITCVLAISCDIPDRLTPRKRYSKARPSIWWWASTGAAQG